MKSKDTLDQLAGDVSSGKLQIMDYFPNFFLNAPFNAGMIANGHFCEGQWAKQLCPLNGNTSLIQ